MSEQKEEINVTYVEVVYQRWIESEAGWGQRPDGISLHLTGNDCKLFIENHWNQEKKRNPSGTPPEIYSRPEGSPGLLKIPIDYIDSFLLKAKKEGKHGTFISDQHFGVLYAASAKL